MGSGALRAGTRRRRALRRAGRARGARRGRRRPPAAAGRAVGRAGLRAVGWLAVHRRRDRRRGALRRLAAGGALLAGARRRAAAPRPVEPERERREPLDRARDRAAERRRSGTPRPPARPRAARRGHDVVVVAGTLAAGEESMEYVADELGVRLLQLPVLQRELSPRADPAAILALRRIIRQRRPGRPPHAHGQGRRHRAARRRLRGPRPAARDRPHLPRPRPQRLLQQALGTRLPLDREGARAHVRDADRRQRGGARRPRRLRRRAGAALRRRPVRLRAAAWSEADDEARRALRAEIGAATEHVRRRLGRAPDRDQASARPDPDAARAPGRGRRRVARARRRR